RGVLEANGATGDLDTAVTLAGGSPRRAFEALLLGDAGALNGLRHGLASAATARVAVHLALAGTLAGSRDGAEARFGRAVVLQWMAEEAKEAARNGNRPRLASANELWEKANALLEDTDEYNLDARQTLVAIFDAIKRHAQSHIAVP